MKTKEYNCEEKRLYYLLENVKFHKIIKLINKLKDRFQKINFLPYYTS